MKITFKKHISDNPVAVNQLLDILNIHLNTPNTPILGGEYLMIADCGSGKTYTVASDIFGKTCGSYINIIASPNVSQVIQNNHKYNLSAVAGKSHLVEVKKAPVGRNVVYDKLSEVINKIKDDGRLADVLLFVDEAQQLIDATYREETIREVKAACRQVINAGGRVVYMTATPTHISLAPPDESGYKYAEVINFVKEFDVKNFNRVNICLFKDIKSFPYEIVNHVKAGKYCLIQNNNKDINLHMLKFFQSQGINAAVISADDTNYSVKSKEYMNNAYNGIISEGKINFGPKDDQYQVILTTCLLNNGTSIDALYEDNEDVRKNTESIFVCNNKKEFNLDQIHQFFVRVRYDHIQNYIYMSGENTITENNESYEPFDSYFNRYVAGFINKKEYAYRKANILAKKADEAYCKYICTSEEFLKEGVSDYFKTPSFVYHNTEKTENGFYDNSTLWQYSKEDVIWLKDIIQTAAEDKEVFYRFSTWGVNPDGLNPVRETIKDIDPVLAKYIADILTLYHGATGSFDMQFVNEALEIAFNNAEYNYAKISSQLNEVKKSFRNLFFGLAKGNIAIEKSTKKMAVIAGSGRRDYKTITLAINSKKQIIRNIVYGYDQSFSNVYGPKQVLFELKKNFSYKYYQMIFNDRYIQEWLRLVNECVYAGDTCRSPISWKRLCEIGEKWTSQQLLDLIDYLQVLRNADTNAVNILNLMMDHKLSVAKYIESKANHEGFWDKHSWEGALITYEDCKAIAMKLKRIVANRNDLRPLASSEAAIVAKIFKLIAYKYTYKRRTVEVTIPRSNGRDIKKKSTAIYLTGLRQTVNSLDPIDLSFFEKEESAAQATKTKVSKLYDKVEDLFDYKEARKFEKFRVNSHLFGTHFNTPFYDLEKIEKKGLLEEFNNTVELFKTAIVKREIAPNGKSSYVGMGVIDSTSNGCFISKRFKRDFGLTSIIAADTYEPYTFDEDEYNEFQAEKSRLSLEDINAYKSGSLSAEYHTSENIRMVVMPYNTDIIYINEFNNVVFDNYKLSEYIEHGI